MRNDTPFGCGANEQVVEIRTEGDPDLSCTAARHDGNNQAERMDKALKPYPQFRSRSYEDAAARKREDEEECTINREPTNGSLVSEIERLRATVDHVRHNHY